MNFSLKLILICVLINDCARSSVDASITSEFLTRNNYPVEEHKVQTEDGYMLTIYRIPHSSNEVAQTNRRPPVLLQHGIVSKSDAWVISDTKLGLAYQLADAGFDVWLSNQRGNTYSREHETLTIHEHDFWNFSFHEIGYYDTAAVVDYICSVSMEDAVHFVGYSQGTSTLFVLLTTRPEYAERIRTVHLLAPVVFMQSMRTYIAKIGGYLLKIGMWLSQLFGFYEVLQSEYMPMHKLMCTLGCRNGSPLQYICQKTFEIIGGLGTKNLDVSVLEDLCMTHPAGASSKQVLHFLQVYNTGVFRQYDYGSDALNFEYYQQAEPPIYDITNFEKCVHLYYSHNDYLSAAQDVIQLSTVLKCAQLHELPYDDWNHHDFLWSINANEALNHNIIDIMKEFEQSLS